MVVPLTGREGADQRVRGRALEEQGLGKATWRDTADDGVLRVTYLGRVGCYQPHMNNSKAMGMGR
jgi:hypothetical protein